MDWDNGKCFLCAKLLEYVAVIIHTMNVTITLLQQSYKQDI